MQISGETLTWTAVGILLVLFISKAAEVWFGANIGTILDKILSGLL
ncbi:hypothetical protein [Lysinibacillus fusiformis]|nr:hypothetical protein [Lysinibacillus fusiformis]WEA41764.1 hypothetical protein PWJ66_23680 [Lysinibacillus fusiformis]